MSAECDGVLDRVWATLDGELSATEVAEIHAHLEACAPCLEEYEVEAALKALVRRCCVERAPDQLRARIVDSITSTTTVSSSTTVTAGGDGRTVITRVTKVTTVEG